MRKTALILLGIAALAIVVASAHGQAPEKPTAAKLSDFAGTWEASLNNGTEEVPFGLEIKVNGDKVDAAVLNGPERWPFSSASIEKSGISNILKLRFDQYDGTLWFKLGTMGYCCPMQASGGHQVLIGQYSRPYAKGMVTYPFQAQRHNDSGYVGDVLPNASLRGDWQFTLGSGTKTESVPATFNETKPPLRKLPNHQVKHGDLPMLVSGTIIPVDGDYGLLAGTFQDGKFSLSRFDGIHVILVKGEVLPDGSIKGLIESGKTGRTPFTGVRKQAALKHATGEAGLGNKPNTASETDAYSLTKVKDPNEPFRFSAPDFESGKTVSASDPQFKNKVVLVDIMGTWCPNCHDEEPLLVELLHKYRSQGLEVVSLVYEYADDPPQNKKQIGIYKNKYHADGQYFLKTGTTDDGEIERTLPQLVGFGAYPTTIFVGRDGKVKKIHAGYSGPATGARFDEVKREMEALVKELLAEK